MYMEKEFILTNGELKIPCKRSEPSYGTIRRVVLGVHGLGGSTADAIQEGIAEEMEMFRSASVRFDFPAHGESEENELTLHGCVDSLLTVARWIKEEYADVEDLCIFATGFGAYVTLVALDELLELPAGSSWLSRLPLCGCTKRFSICCRLIGRPSGLWTANVYPLTVPLM